MEVEKESTSSCLPAGRIHGFGHARIVCLRLCKKHKSAGLKGVLDLWGVGSAHLGRPVLAPELPEIPSEQALSLKSVKWGAPNVQIESPTDPKPPLKPSDSQCAAAICEFPVSGLGAPTTQLPQAFPPQFPGVPRSKSSSRSQQFP